MAIMNCVIRVDELEALRRDAARYRWLRNLPGNDEAMLALEAACHDPVTPEQFDAAIDSVTDSERMAAGFGEALALTEKAWQPFLPDPDPETRT